ncbi:Schlafen and ATP-dependent DNA helicase domains-containing protein [Desulfonema limicola]|uniref:Schlafen and ATP-dependent DNA helicase domains-containing protein n=1 Tax=Desulfonema limicola TaxID=45656 RepID=A0A975GHC9_9BACT|nr:ATP-binding protein [Desulfonema limicola]QTA81281.1 Schlafen and ATP-dependent DNA helicase domains-containing protein [Desulfonema limicola]
MKNIEEILKKGESPVTEFKLDSVKNEQIAKELGALANFRGGMLILGVDDKGIPCGLTRDDNEERIQNICYNFEPPLQVKIEHNTVNNKPVVIVTIIDNNEKPYAYKSQTRNIYYIRSGTVSREAARSELRRMFQQSGELHYEALALSNAPAKTLDYSLMTSFFKDYRFISLDDYMEQEKEIVLNNLSILHGKSTTFLGQILFGKEPRKYIPCAGINAGIYKGRDKASGVIDHHFFQGPLIQEIPLVFKYLSLFNRSGFDNIQDKRKEKQEYPEQAVREAVINAVCHRDYTVKGSGIMIDIFKDHMEIISPGSLPNTQTISKIKMGMIYQRNPLLVQYLYDFRYVERLGRGIQKIMQTMKDNGNPEPEFINGDNYFKVELRKSV